MPAGVVTLIETGLLLITLAGAPPNVTVAPEPRLIPVMTTASPPAGEPVAGESRFNLGAIDTTGAMKVNALESVPVSPALLMTVTPVVPPACGGVVAVIVVLFTTTTLVAVAKPKLTVAPAATFVPVIVTAVVNDQIGPAAVRLAMVFETIFQRYVVPGVRPDTLKVSGVRGPLGSSGCPVTTFEAINGGLFAVPK